MNEVMHSGMGSDEIYEPTVWWYDKLLFLVPFVKTRKSKSSLESVMETDSQHETLETESDVSGDTSVSRNQTAVTSANSVKKRKVQEDKFGPDPVIDQAVTTLKTLEDKLNSDVQSLSQIFGEYVSRELESIDDDELLNDAKHEITEIIYKTKKKMLAMKKQRAETIEFIFDDDQQ